MSDATADGVPAGGSAQLGADGRPIDWTRVFLGFAGLVIGQFMAILDIQIVASSLVQIQAGIGASADEISWVQTIYLLAEVLVMPLTGYMTKIWGTRNFFLVATIAFIVTSVATGLSTSIDVMIVTRALQGLAAGAMIPPVFAVAMTVFPPDRRLTANVVIGAIITLAPTIGPTLGGHLTESLSWRWLFFINVPVGAPVVFLVGRYGNFDRPTPSLARGLDWPGLGLLAVFLLSMQYVVEEGSKNNWFEDDAILWLTVAAVIGGGAFIWRQLAYANPIVSLKPFKDRNFAVGSLMNFVLGFALFGGTFIIPLFLGQALGYNSAQVGNTMLVSGLVMMVGSPVFARLVRVLDLRLSLLLGFVVTGIGVGLGAHINRNWGFWDFAALQALRASGLMLSMVAAQQLTVSTLPVTLMKDASGLMNLIRNTGGAMGLALLSTVLRQQSAVHYSELASGVTVANSASAGMLAALGDMMTTSGVADPDGAARKAFSMLLHREALVMAFADAFYVLAIGGFVVGGFALLANAPPPGPARAGGAH